jgi:ketosteroid isomerase-like protein
MFEEGRRLSADEAKTIVRRRFDELDQGNLGIIDELFSPDYKLNFPGRDHSVCRKQSSFKRRCTRRSPTSAMKSPSRSRRETRS